ncbi:hypothetical protein TVNIR_3322 [Thioalkalivibrio nitratireducens DSM 14787]|uniref:Uncharacterized protein n=1 Tax=Thioalkalivibrio nitratireducens (strain DSM 14787 / UNIQEM 213 / ALEN2) TaxID=1255043 RepID=L0E141_THIND|nr:hypothetical protein TVNIR_3322 [Thioalkalivibrio nitratireducens DSM 14787]
MRRHDGHGVSLRHFRQQITQECQRLTGKDEVVPIHSYLRPVRLWLRRQ